MASATINKNFDGDFEVIINHRIKNGYELQYPMVEDGVKWETDRQGSPGKLTFKVYKDKTGNLNFQEGDAVILRYKDETKGWVNIFNGYIFTKSRSKKDWIDVTAYDQLRYFKNKGTYVYTNKKASDLVKMIANDYKLTLGTIENTSYVIGNRVEDDQSLFDIIQNSLDLTLASTNNLYVLYSDNGKLCLRDAMNMKTNVVINESVAEDFDYSSSIDDETYNEVELYYDNDKTNKREYYNAADTNNISNWGRLRYTESLQNPTNAKDRAKKMLKLYNRKTRELKVKKAFGSYECRAGASVIVQLSLGDITVNNYMLIEKATHTFKKNEYRMDLTLSGFVEDTSNSSIIYSEANVSDTTSSDDKKKGGTGGGSNTYKVKVNIAGATQYAGTVRVTYYDSKKNLNSKICTTKGMEVSARKGTTVKVTITPNNGHSFLMADVPSYWKHPDIYTYKATADRTLTLTVRWVR